MIVFGLLMLIVEVLGGVPTKGVPSKGRKTHPNIVASGKTGFDDAFRAPGFPSKLGAALCAVTDPLQWFSFEAHILKAKIGSCS
jgi:hypothetical protein